MAESESGSSSSSGSSEHDKSGKVDYNDWLGGSESENDSDGEIRKI